MIACVLVPAFIANVERQANPELAQHPCIVEAAFGRQRYVYALCAQALKAGIAPGMPVRQAEQLDPDVILMPANLPRYRKALDTLADSLSFFSDQVEVEGLPRFGRGWRRRGLPVLSTGYHAVGYVDLGPVQPAEGLDLARQLQRHVETGVRMQASVGVATRKFTAFTAARVTKAGQAPRVVTGNEAAFLARWPVRLLPLEPEMARRLRLFGIETLGAFAALPAGAVLAQFGKAGRLLHQLARGEDNRPVQRLQKRRAETVRLVFDDPVDDELILQAVVEHLAAMLAERLAKLRYATRALRLSLTFADHHSHEAEVVLRRPTDDPARLGQRGWQLRQGLPRRWGVTEVELAAMDLVVVEHRQLELFASDGQEQQATGALNDLIARFGAACFYRATVTDTAALVPSQRFELETVDAA